MRYRDGRFTTVVPSQAGAVNGIYADPCRTRVGRGAQRSHPRRRSAAAAPRVTVYGRAEGLADTVQVVTGDADGRVYAGTSRGVDRLDPRSGEVTHFSAANGLTGGEFKSAFRDRHGVLWLLHDERAVAIRARARGQRGAAARPDRRPSRCRDRASAFGARRDQRRSFITAAQSEQHPDRLLRHRAAHGRCAALQYRLEGAEGDERAVAAAQRPLREPGARHLPVLRARRRHGR